MKKYLTVLLSLIMMILISSCGGDKKVNEVDNDMDKKVANRGEALMKDEVDIGEMATYPDVAENKSESMDRSFENAPPLIPHTVKGMMVITKEHNQCLNCHRPEKAKAEGATPMPSTHFTDYRPQIVENDGVYKVKAEEGEITSVSTKNKKVNMAQYNCNQCHVPQTNATVEIKNTFKPVFRNSSSKGKSNLSDNISEGVK